MAVERSNNVHDKTRFDFLCDRIFEEVVELRKKQTPLEKEWAKVEKQEQTYLQKHAEKKDSKLNQLLEGKVPADLQKTLDTAFAKAFQMVFEKGLGIIEKTYKKEQLEKSYQVNEYTAQVMEDSKSLKAFSKKASGTGNVNLLLSGVSGIGLGALGVGIPDIVLFTGLMLKSVYEIALSYGFDYTSRFEKHFILLLIQGALASGEELEKINTELNLYIETGTFSGDVWLNKSIEATASCLSKELLYMKFLQGIPIVGAVGGAYDVIYTKQVVKYAEMKYRRRFYQKRKQDSKQLSEKER